jgi:flagellar FliL protein
VSAPAATDASAPKPKGKKMVVILAAVVVLLAVAGGAFMFMNKGGDAEEGEEGGKAAEVAHAKPKDGTPPTFLPLENMVVNLADPGGQKFAQVGVTVEVMDQKTADRVKAYLPTIRSAVLMLISQRTSEELLSKDGKEKLARDIHREVSAPLGYEVEDDEPEAEAKPAKRKKARAAFNPIYGVLFSSFIVQ